MITLAVLTLVALATGFFDAIAGGGGLIIVLLGGHVLCVTGLAMGAGQFAGSRLGARAVIGGGARLVRPMIVVTSRLMATRLLMSPGNPARAWIMNALSGVFGG